MLINNFNIKDLNKIFKLLRISNDSKYNNQNIEIKILLVAIVFLLEFAVCYI